MNSDNAMEAMLQDQHARAMARLADNPNDRLASLLVKNREQALADLLADEDVLLDKLSKQWDDYEALIRPSLTAHPAKLFK